MSNMFISIMMSVLFLFSANSSWADSWIQELRTLPVQDAGRIKPFDTFAIESLKLVYGKSKLNGKRAPDVVLTWILAGDQWINAPIIELAHAGVKEALGFEPTKKYYTPQEILTNVKFPLILQELENRQKRQEKLNPYFQAVQRVENQLGLLQAIKQGRAPGIAPSADGDTWKAPAELPESLMGLFSDMAKSYVAYITAEQGSDKAALNSAEKELAAKIVALKEGIRHETPEKYPEMRKVNLEVHYNQFHPFQWAWITYLIGVLAFISFFVSGKSWQGKMGWVFIVMGFLLHTYGMGLRIYLAGRPPVSNMYETVVWVPWGAVFFGFILERIQKNKILLICAASVAIFCLILTDLAPAVLDPSIHPLEPVLRSTFWLTTHVLIITISYAAFFLAFALGDLLLFYYLVDEKKFHTQIQQGVISIYRCIQIGVVLLASGIILGGIWADYSWGRFWGWDPKETWALIALLGYLAILHGRLTGLVRQFGLVASSVLSFSLVIMAWYGVNFVLGAGLHSYGFGAGGVEYVTGFVVLQILFVVYVSTVRYGRQKSQQSK